MFVYSLNRFTTINVSKFVQALSSPVSQDYSICCFLIEKVFNRKSFAHA